MNDSEEVKSPENRHQMRYVNPRRRGEGSYEAKKAREDVYVEGAEKKRDSSEETACKEAPDKVLKETFAGVKNLKFKARLEEYIRESESGPLPFKNEKHRAIFTEAVKQMNQEDTDSAEFNIKYKGKKNAEINDYKQTGRGFHLRPCETVLSHER